MFAVFCCVCSGVVVSLPLSLSPSVYIFITCLFLKNSKIPNIHFIAGLFSSLRNSRLDSAKIDHVCSVDQKSSSADGKFQDTRRCRQVIEGKNKMSRARE